MGINAIEVTAAVLISFGFLFTSIAVGMPFWEQNDPEDTVNDKIIRYKGLWVKCTTYITGNWECDDFNRFFLGLPPMLQAARGFGITAILLSLIASLLIILGMENIPCARDNKSLKRRVRCVAGALSVIGGFCIIVAAAWYANQIRLEYDVETARKMSGANVRRVVFGAALFIAWAGGALLVIGGLVGICTGCGDRSYEEEERRIYKPAMAREYV